MLRKITSLTLFLSFLLTTLTSIILFIEPHGRVAYWADWRFWGLSKTQWDNIHLTLGLLLLLAGIVHAWLNWKPILAYLKNKARELTVINRASIAALAITAFVFAGTLLGWPPMQQLIDFMESVKEGQTSTYGNPPYGHAELTKLGRLAGQMDIDLDRALSSLREVGIEVPSTDMNLQELARLNDTTPKNIFEIMKGKEAMALPAAPPEGTGKMTLTDFSKQYNLTLSRLVSGLEERGFTATAEMTIKEIAEDRGMHPMEVYGVLREISMTPAEQPAGVVGTGAGGGAGLGRMTLEDFAAHNAMDANRLLEQLSARGVEASLSSTLREVASQLGTTPHDLLEELE